MRRTLVLLCVLLLNSSLFAQLPPQQAQAPRVANRAAAPAANRPFPALPAAEQAKLNQLLFAWEQVSNGTTTLECKFKRWHYDLFQAPAGTAASVSIGAIRYAAPDKGLFKVDEKALFKEMRDGKPQFKSQEGQLGEHWVCNGRELIEFDHGKQECRVQQLPPNLQGKEIFNSPLPFVFNLNAQKIQQRFWVREVQSPVAGTYLIEAWPKTQNDRAQYKMVQIALDKENFLPKALVMYAPNFNAKTQPKWDHYEFTDMKRNAVAAKLMGMFAKRFIDERPPANYKVLREPFAAPQAPPPNVPVIPANQVPGARR